MRERGAKVPGVHVKTRIRSALKLKCKSDGSILNCRRDGSILETVRAVHLLFLPARYSRHEGRVTLGVLHGKQGFQVWKEDGRVADQLERAQAVGATIGTLLGGVLGLGPGIKRLRRG